MYPFFKNDDYVLIENSHPHPKRGNCVLLNNNIHRYLSSKTVKGDRLLYIDPFINNSLPLVSGRIIFKQTNSFYVSNHHHLILRLISILISILSENNIEKRFGRRLIVIQIIVLSSLHRILEPLFIKKIKT